MTESIENHSIPPFRAAFKYYKRRQPSPDFSNVIDFHTDLQGSSHPDKVQVSPLQPIPVATDLQCRNVGLKPLTQWQCYTIKEFPGFIFIRNPFLNCGQRYWIRRCLQDFHAWPNNTNLRSHISLAVHENLWDTSQYCYHHDSVKSNETTQNNKDLMDRLRWATLGYQYDWTTKEYYPNKKNDFPTDLAELSKLFTAAIGFDSYSPEAAIINYYKLDSTLSGHTDHSEFDLTAPLISVSFGQKAIFLLGSQTLSTTPAAMYVENGDVCIMSAKSRLAYHAVPRIIYEKNSCGNLMDRLLCECGKVISNFDHPCCECCRMNNTQAFEDSNSNDSVAKGPFMDISDCDAVAIKSNVNNCIPKRSCQNQDDLQALWMSFHKYLQGGRININVRQVLQTNGTFPVKSLSVS